MTHDDLDTRLAAMERHVPVEAPPPVLPARGRRGRRSLPLAAAPILVLVFAGAVVAATGLQAVFLPGPATLTGAGLECMTPPKAAAWLEAHGYDKVVWDTVIAPDGLAVAGDADGSGAQAPIGDPIAVPNDGSGITGRTVTGGTDDPLAPVPGSRQLVPPDGIDVEVVVSSSSTVPPSGIVIVASKADGVLHVLVDQTPGAARPDTCSAR